MALQVYDVKYGPHKKPVSNLHYGPNEADLMLAVLQQGFADRQWAHTEFPPMLEARTLYGLEDVGAGNGRFDIPQDVILDFILNVPQDEVPSGLEAATFPPGHPNEGLPIFTQQQIDAVTAARAMSKVEEAYSRMTPEERDALVALGYPNVP